MSVCSALIHQLVEQPCNNVMVYLDFVMLVIKTTMVLKVVLKMSSISYTAGVPVESCTSMVAVVSIESAGLCFLWNNHPWLSIQNL